MLEQVQLDLAAAYLGDDSLPLWKVMLQPGRQGANFVPDGLPEKRVSACWSSFLCIWGEGGESRYDLPGAGRKSSR